MWFSLFISQPLPYEIFNCQDLCQITMYFTNNGTYLNHVIIRSFTTNQIFVFRSRNASVHLRRIAIASPIRVNRHESPMIFYWQKMIFFHLFNTFAQRRCSFRKHCWFVSFALENSKEFVHISPLKRMSCKKQAISVRDGKRAKHAEKWFEANKAERSWEINFLRLFGWSICLELSSRFCKWFIPLQICLISLYKLWFAADCNIFSWFKISVKWKLAAFVFP